jgi:hypothetical protein
LPGTLSLSGKVFGRVVWRIVRAIAKKNKINGNSQEVGALTLHAFERQMSPVYRVKVE